jgi:hypothetical protein
MIYRLWVRRLTTILPGLCKAARTSTVDARRDVLLALHYQGAVEEMISRMELTIRSASIHVRQLFLHFVAGKHGDILNA